MTVNGYDLAMQLMDKELWPIIYATSNGITCVYFDASEETANPKLRNFLLNEDDETRYTFMIHFIPALDQEGVINRE